MSISDSIHPKLDKQEITSILHQVFTQKAMEKKLKEKDEEIQRLGKLNWLFRERLNSLSVENHMWRNWQRAI